MKGFVILLLFIFFQMAAFSQTAQEASPKCKGLLNCTRLYEKLTEQTISTKEVPPNVTEFGEELVLNKKFRDWAFFRYINEAGYTIMRTPKNGTLLSALRKGAFLSAPIFKVDDSVLERFKNSKEKINLILYTKVHPKNMLDESFVKLMSKEKDVNISEFPDQKIILVSERGTNAVAIVRELQLRDK